MEFYRQLERCSDEAQLQALLSLGRLPQLCDSIDELLEQQGDQGRIYCLWGSFQVNREPIKNGVRFTLPGCPNALAWTITAEAQNVTIHCTINRPDHDADFLASIEQFVDDWQTGLAGALQATP